MKLKNKRLFLMSMLCTLGVGMLTLSIGGLVPHKADRVDTAADSDNKPQVEEAFSDHAISAAPTIAVSIAPVTTAVSTPTPVPTEIPAASPTPEPLMVYPLEAEGYPKINILFQDYYLAKLACDTEKMKELLSDPAYCPSIEKLEKEAAYIDDYNNLQCYVKKSYESDSYIVYVYYEVTYLNIKTPAPFIDKFYVITDMEGKLKIYSPEYQPEFERYYIARDMDQDVMELVEKTNEKSKKAIKKDKDLKIYLEKLSGWKSKNK